MVEAPLLDLLMIVFTLLVLGLSRAGKPARAERALVLACATASAYMNVSAADVTSPRSVAAYTVAPVALAAAVDRVVAVIRRHVLPTNNPRPGQSWAAPRRPRLGSPGWWGCTCCGSPWPRGRLPGACAGWCWTLLRCPRSRGRPHRNQSSRLRPRRPSCSPCTAPIRTTVTAGEPAGSPPSWPRGPCFRQEPPGPGPDRHRRVLRRQPSWARCPVLDRPGPRHLHHPAGRPAALGRHRAPLPLRRLRTPRLLAPPHPRHLGTVHPGRRMAPHLRRQTPRPSPCAGVLRPLAARHHAPHHRHHPPMRDAPRPRWLGCSSWISLILCRAGLIPAIRQVTSSS